MDPVTIIATLALVAIVTFASLYLLKQRKRGVKCIGCPLGRMCIETRNTNGVPSSGAISLPLLTKQRGQCSCERDR